MSTYPAKYRYHGKVVEDYNISRQSSDKWQREVEIIKNLLDGFQINSSILDVPVGTGRFLEYYRNRGSFIIGIDMSVDMLMKTRKSFKGDNNSIIYLIRGESENLPIPDSSVDYVICMRLLNWVPMDILKLIVKEFARVVRRRVVIEIRVSRQKSVKDFWVRWIIDIVKMRPWATSLFHKIKHYKIASNHNINLNNAGSSIHSVVDTGYNLHRETDVSALFNEIGLVQINQYLVDMKVSFSKRELRPFYVYVLEPMTNIN